MQWNCNMRVVLFLMIVCSFVACKKEEVFLVQSNVSVVNEVVDHSPVYIFFEMQNNDTIAVVNRKNTISTTNWLFNIDKRLPLRLVIPEISNLQEKREKAVFHKNDNAQNYFTYNDTLTKNLAFFPFTKVKFFLSQPEGDSIILLDKHTKITMDNNELDSFESLITLLKSKEIKERQNYQLQIDKNATLSQLLEVMIAFKTVGLEDMYNKVYIY